MTTFHLTLERHSAHPLHRQIHDGLRQAILDGRLRPGVRIPSTRGMAADLGVSRLPVLTAYEQLLHEGYLVGRVGSGTFVNAALPDDLLRAHPESSPVVRPRDGAVPGPSREDGGLGPFRVSLPALDQFPHAAWARLVSRHAHALTHAEMAYGDPAGLASLRAAIADHVRTARAVRCEAEQVLVVSGSQAGLRLAAAVLLATGRRVAVEEPSSPAARAALTAGGARLAPVPVDEEGMSVTRLEALGSSIRAAYVTPSHQYPLGRTMTAPRRLALLEWATRRSAWILEDDYDSEYRYVSRPLGSLQGMDAHDRVVYLGTFSKVLYPALRLGYVIAPRSLWQQLVETREAFDLFSPTLYQAALAEFLREGHFVRHLRRMRGVYLARRDALLGGLARHCGDRLTVCNADAGLHVAALLPPGVDDEEVVRRMARRGLTATALSTCYAGLDRRSGLLLGFGGSTERRLLEATRVLSDILKRID